jgi:hypothetical protein
MILILTHLFSHWPIPLKIIAAGKGYLAEKTELICGPYTPRFRSYRKKFSISKYLQPAWQVKFAARNFLDEFQKRQKLGIRSDASALT